MRSRKARTLEGAIEKLRCRGRRGRGARGWRIESRGGGYLGRLRGGELRGRWGGGAALMARSSE